MGLTTNIAWCDATVNPWWGCTKIADECSRCYAADLSHRYGRADWGDKAERWIRVDKAISELRKIAKRTDLGRPPRVFIGSMLDILEDRPELDAPRSLMFEAVDELAGKVVALFLSKRIGNAVRMMPAHWRNSPPPWVWWGTSVGHPKREPEIQKLIETPAAVRFVSAEPLLGAIDLERAPWEGKPDWYRYDALRSGTWTMGGGFTNHSDMQSEDRRIHWVIIGGESGSKRREMDMGAAERLARQCVDAGVAVFFKQDSGARPGTKGRAPDWLWALKQHPGARP